MSTPKKFKKLDTLTTEEGSSEFEASPNKGKDLLMLSLPVSA